MRFLVSSPQPLPSPSPLTDIQPTFWATHSTFSPFPGSSPRNCLPRAAEQVMSRSKWFSTWEIRGSAGRRRVLEPQPQGSKQALPSDFGLVPP